MIKLSHVGTLVINMKSAYCLQYKTVRITNNVNCTFYAQRPHQCLGLDCILLFG
jgi:hypothetical protein